MARGEVAEVGMSLRASRVSWWWWGCQGLQMWWLRTCQGPGEPRRVAGVQFLPAGSLHVLGDSVSEPL